MQIQREREYTMSGNNHSNFLSDDNKLKYTFDINMLQIMCSYAISTNKMVTRMKLQQMRKLFDQIDLNVYINEQEKMNKIRIIRRALSARLDENLNKPELILCSINGGFIDGHLSLSDFPELSIDEVNFIDKNISGALNCATIDNEMNYLFDFYSRYKNAEFQYRDSMVEEYKQMIERLNCELRRNSIQSVSEKSFSFDSRTVNDQLQDVHESLTSSSRFLYTGMQGFNSIIGGALESTRLYMMLGLGGIGKSMVMLNVALQIKEFNKGYKTKDPTKKPTILFLTQENTMEETVDRVCTISTGHKISHYSKEEIADVLLNECGLAVTDENNMNIHIVYRPDRSINTNDIYTIVENIALEGYEVACIIQDHVKRIRSIEKINDPRIELGYVTNEFKNIAIKLEVPFITVAHLNRNAAAKMDNAGQGHKSDKTRLLGKQDIGESMLMFDNSDYVIIIDRDYDEDGNAYMIFKNEKSRSSAIELDYVCHPFEGGRGTKLVCDLYDVKPSYRTTLMPESRSNSGNTVTRINGINIKPSGYTNVPVMEESDDDCLFGSFIGSKYTSTGGRTITPEDKTTKSQYTPTVSNLVSFVGGDEQRKVG